MPFLALHAVTPELRAKLESAVAACHAAMDAVKAASRASGTFSPEAKAAESRLRAAVAARSAVEAECRAFVAAADADAAKRRQAMGDAAQAAGAAALRRANPAVVAALGGADLPGRESVMLASGRGEPLHFEGGKAVLLFGWDKLPAQVLSRLLAEYASRTPGVKRNKALAHLAGQPATVGQSRSGNAWCVRLGSGAPLRVVSGRVPGKPSLPTTTGGAAEHYVSLA